MGTGPISSLHRCFIACSASCKQIPKEKSDRVADMSVQEETKASDALRYGVFVLGFKGLMADKLRCDGCSAAVVDHGLRSGNVVWVCVVDNCQRVNWCALYNCERLAGTDTCVLSNYHLQINV